MLTPPALQLGTPFAETNLDGAIKGIRDLLQRNGLHLTSRVPKVDRDPGDAGETAH